MRRVPPVHSPIPPAALAAGVGALLRPDQALRERVEARVAARFGARAVLLTDSGTTALRLALSGAVAATGGRAAAAALPAFGCYDLVTALRGAGTEGLLYDVEPRTLSPVPGSLRRTLERGAGVLVVAHLYGVPVDLDEARAAATDAGALLVEDAAQGVGGAYGSRPLGSHGSLSVLSFGRGKGLTGGGGGALLAHDDLGEAVLEEAATAIESEPSRGGKELVAALAQWALGRPSLFGLPASLPWLGLGDTVYRPPRRPAWATSACLAVLERSWDASSREAEERRRRAARLIRSIRAVPDLRVVEPPARGRAGYLRLPVLARRASARRRLSAPSARRLGVTPSYPEPLHRLAAFREAGGGEGKGGDEALRGAAFLARSLFTLPVHGRASRADLDRLLGLIAASDG